MPTGSRRYISNWGSSGFVVREGLMTAFETSLSPLLFVNIVSRPKTEIFSPFVSNNIL